MPLKYEVGNVCAERGYDLFTGETLPHEEVDQLVFHVGNWYDPDFMRTLLVCKHCGCVFFEE